MKNFILILLTFFVTSIATAQNIFYVKTDGITSASNAINAITWDNACADLQAIINVSDSGDVIWVAEGTYFPIHPADSLMKTDSNNRNNAFVLKKDIQIYGGFAGNETSVNERNWDTHKSIFSGDIGLLDDSTDNCYHVVISAGDMGTAILDGFTITKGNANNNDSIVINDATVYSNYGGGMYNAFSSAKFNNLTISNNTSFWGGGIFNIYSSDILTNTTVTDNFSYWGGGMYNRYSSLTLINSTISNNTTTGGSGGGIYNHSSSITLENVLISNNFAKMVGGGMINSKSSSPLLINVRIINNSATLYGGGIINVNISSPILVNVLIASNIAFADGGGLYNEASSSPTLTNVTISNNIASGLGGGIKNMSGHTTINNSIIAGNIANNAGNDIHTNSNSSTSVSLHSSLLQDAETGNSVTKGSGYLENMNPLFADTANQDYSLQINSPCVNAGNDNLYLTTRNISDFTNEIDLAGNSRFFSSSIDMGAYEQQSVDVIRLRNTKMNIQLYPNPANNILYIQSSSNIEQVIIYDISGRMLKQIYSNIQKSILVNDLANGIYLIKIKAEDGETVQKIVKN